MYAKDTGPTRLRGARNTSFEANVRWQRYADNLTGRLPYEKSPWARLADSTRSAAASTWARKTGSRWAFDNTAAVISGITLGSTVRTRSPPAEIKSTARSPGDHPRTCTARPRSSLMTRPVKLRSPRRMPVTIVRENAAGEFGSRRRYVAVDTMTIGAPALIAAAKGIR